MGMGKESCHTCSRSRRCLERSRRYPCRDYRRKEEADDVTKHDRLREGASG